MTTDNVFASPVYNPNYDTPTLALYGLMTNKAVDEAQLATYREIVMNYTTQNIYAGVLYNPRACEINDVKNQLDDFVDQLDKAYQDAITKGTPTQGGPSAIPDPDGTFPYVPPYTPTPEQVNTANQWQASYPGWRSDALMASEVMDAYYDHTNRIVANLPGIIGVTQSQIGNVVATTNPNGAGSGSTTGSGTNSSVNPGTTTGNSGSSAGSGLDLSQINMPSMPGAGGNPCLQFGDIMGSLFAQGQKMLDQMSRAVMGAIGALMNPQALMQQAMSAVMGMASQIMSKLMGEINKLAQSIMNMAKMGLAQLLQFMPNDPCMKSIIGGALTSAAGSALKGIF
jgi:hypothetical protein